MACRARLIFVCKGFVRVGIFVEAQQDSARLGKT
jgi:hypothetical protein